MTPVLGRGLDGGLGGALAGRLPPGARRRRMPLVRATVRCYRNAGVRAYRRAPEATLLGGLAGAVLYAAALALQLQALASSVDLATLSQIQRDGLADVTLAAATVVAVIALGTHLVLGMIGTSAPALLSLAAHKPVGRWELALSSHGLDVGLSVVAGLAVGGPISALTVFQVGRAGGAGTTAALVGAVGVPLAAAVSGVAGSLLVGALCRLAGGRLSRDTTRSLAFVAQGMLIIAATGLVLSGHTRGLLLVCPAFALTPLTTLTAASTGVLLLAAAAWLLVALSLASAADGRLRHRVRSGGSVVRLRDGGTLRRVGLVALLRDPLYVAAAVLTVAGSLLVHLLVVRGDIATPQASLLVLVLTSMWGLSLVTSVFGVAASLWVYRVRPEGYATMVRHLRRHALTLSAAVTVVAVCGAGLLATPAVGLVAVAGALFSCALALLCSVVVFRAGTSAEQRGRLLLGGLLAVVGVGVGWVLIMRLPGAADHWPAMGAYLAAATLVGARAATAAAARVQTDHGPTARRTGARREAAPC